MKEKAKKQKPKYGIISNCLYMVKMAKKADSLRILWHIFLLVTSAVITNLCNLFIAPEILKRVENKSEITELILTILFFTLPLILLSALERYVNTITLWPRVNTRLEVVYALNGKMADTSMPNFESTAFKEKAEKASQAVESNSSAAEAIWNVLTDIFINLGCFIIYLLLLTNVEPLLVIVTLITSVLGYFVNKRINRWGYDHREEEYKLINEMSNITNSCQNISLGKDIRVFSMRPWLEGLYKTTNNLMNAFIAKRESVYLWTNIIDVILSFLRNGIAYFYLITMVIKGNLSASEFLLYYGAINGFTNFIISILEHFTTLYKQSLEISTLREFTETPEPFKFEEGKSVKESDFDSFELELKDVSFKYPEAESYTLKNVNLKIKPGEKLAIVGLNGAGKTTIVKLLCGFYDPTEGQVLLNGIDIREFNRRDYYKLICAVFQKFSKLSVTLAENVAQTREGINKEKVLECLNKAGLSEKIENLPKGIDTHIGKEVFEDGVELSGGELQRLMLARALYKASPLLILDEPTAALDPIAENDIYLKYSSMTEGKTSLFISHRLASTRFCDRIIFIAEGGIAEEGTHESLLAKKGKYAELFEVQAQYYKDGKEGKM